MNSQNSSDDVETKLAKDTTGNYKNWLLDELRQHKNHFEEFKGKMLPADEYEQCEYLIHAINAAINIIESKRPGIEQNGVFNNLFY